MLLKCQDGQIYIYVYDYKIGFFPVLNHNDIICEIIEVGKKPAIIPIDFILYRWVFSPLI
jgi:hypothetical protein